MSGDDEQQKEELQAALRQFQELPFPLVIEVLSSGHRVVPIHRDQGWDRRLIEKLSAAAKKAGEEAQKGIDTKRPNEAGNKMEEFLLEALRKEKLSPTRPTSKSGKTKSAGYPDFEVQLDGRAAYLECKTFDADKDRGGGLRVFYLSPSDDFKVTKSAPHLLVAFGMRRGEDGCFRPVCYEIYTLENLVVRLKHEFNAPPEALYCKKSLLDKGEIGAQSGSEDR